MTFPLQAGGFRVGTMLLLGLPHQEHVSAVLSLLTALSTVVALVLRNAFLYERQEQIIQERTAELRHANERLHRELAERREAQSKLKESEERLRLTLEATQIGIWDWDVKNDRWYASPIYYSMLGYEPKPGSADRREWLERVHPDDRAMVQEKIQEVLARDFTSYEYEARMRHADGSYRWHSVTGFGIERDADGKAARILGTRTDIDERRQAEEALRRLNRELRAISNCNQTLVRAVDEQALLTDICRIVCDDAGYRMAWVGYAENDDAKTVRPVAWAGAEDEYLAGAGITWSDTPRGRGPAGTAIRSGESATVGDFASDDRVLPWRDGALQHGYRSAIALPLNDESGHTFGALCIYAAEPEAFTPAEARLLKELSGDLALGVSVLRSRAERRQADEERQAHLSFLESLDQVNQTITRETDVTAMLQNIVETMLVMFGCDRAWLFYPCDPEAETFRVPVEASRPKYPGAGAIDHDLPMDPSLAADLRKALASEEPLAFSTGTDQPVNELTAKQFGVQAQLFQAIYPRTGKPWVFGMHQCSHPRIWTERERELFREIGHRVADGLSSVLLLRDLRDGEAQLSAAAAEWRATFDAMSDSVALFDAEGKVVRCNASTVALTGRDYAQIIGHACYEIFHGTSAWHESCPQLQARGSLRGETSVFEQGGQWLRVTFHPMTDAKGAFSGGVHVVSDISELKQTEERLRDSLAQVQSVSEEVIGAIAGIVEVRDPYTAGHERRVSELATAIAQQMGFDEDAVRGVRVGGLLHDVGKIGVPAEILTKPTALTAIEFELIKTHPLVAHDLLRGINFPWPVAEMALQHHERLDGSGYPQGLHGDEALIEARILAVADVVEAMASYRPYRPALGVEVALAEIEKNRGRLYDAQAADACLRLFREGGFAFRQRE